MKWIFAILLIINLLFFAVMQPGNSGNRESMRGHEPIKAEKIKLLAELRKAPEMALAMPDVSGKPGETVAGWAKPEVCLEWGIFFGDGLKRATQALEKLQLGDKLAQYKVEKFNSYWVYIPPRKTLQEALKKSDELKKMGMRETFIIRESSKWRYAIPIGIFSSAEAAAKFLEQVRGKGVKSAASGPHSHEVDAEVFQIRGASDSMAAMLTGLKLDFPGSDLKAVECRKQGGAAQ